MNIGAKIKCLRKEKKVTQEELAEYLMISSQAVSKWETEASSPDIDMLPKLAIFFGTSVDNLLDFSQTQVDTAVTELVAECGRHCQGDPVKGEAFMRKALEKYPNNILLLTCLLEFLQEQNDDGGRSSEIIEIGERIQACAGEDEDDLRIDAIRILAETYHSLGEQAMAAYYLAKIPSLHFLYCEVAAGITKGQERLKNIEKTEDLCVWILLSMLKLRKEEADAKTIKELNEQFRKMMALFKAYPSYREAAEIAEARWGEQMD